MIASKYLAGFIQLITLLMTALLAALVDGLTIEEIWQLAGVGVGAVVTIYVPLLQGAWAAGLKVGGAVLGAVIAAVIPLLAGTWDLSSALIVLLAGLNVLATQLGVDVRVDSARKEYARPDLPNAVIETVDAPAAAVILSE